ncbi:MAG: transcription factor, partial [Deltaproteobacteria bacterium]|nr:transcription factor [Deltaproteobacteria bacterium]
MAIPSITSITPATGPSSGGDIVRIAGVDFAPSVSVLFGDVEAEVAFVSSSPCVADVRTPAHVPATVDVTLRNLDDDGNPIPSEEIILADAYRFVREEIVRESDLTRVVRHILRRLKKQVLENTSISVSVDYDDTVVDGLNIVALAEMPSVVLSGPRLRENKFFGTYEAHEELIDGTFGPEVIRHSPPLTMDLEFSLTVASDRTAELLNLMAATATFLNRNRWM